MKIFFAKINNKTELGNQFDNGFYLSKKGSTAYGDLNGVDIDSDSIFVFAICGNEIGLWKAVSWSTDNSQLNFSKQIITTGLNSKTLPSFKYFIINKDLIIFSSRQSNKHFFEINFESTLNEAILIDPTSYSKPENFRKIEVHQVRPNIPLSEYNLLIFKDNQNYKFSCNKNFDQNLVPLFKDNTIYRNGNRNGKNKTLNKIFELSQFAKTFSVAELSIQELYDALFCNYNEKNEIESEESEINNLIQYQKNMEIKTLNTILYGPPGTGKTYSTIEAALQVVLGKDIIKSKSRDEQTTLFRKQLIDFEKETGQIAFTTFHQSMSYEDFIEGIKPVDPKKNNNLLLYEIVPGIFKKLCDLARKAKDNKDDQTQTTMTEKEFNAAEFIKINFKSADIEIAKNCINTNTITFFNEINTALTTPKEELKKKYELNKVNDIGSFIKQSNNLYFIITIDEERCLGVGKVTGEYIFSPQEAIKHTRKVDWFKKSEFPFKEMLKPSAAIKGSFLVIPADSKDTRLKKEFFTNPLSSIEVKEKKEIKKFVLIIDEINRGNIAQIFGELITLIEDEKREGLPEELRVTLPYSKESFSVPENVYIIGTMNTADRSVEALDTALRRRFSFIELAPNEKHEEINKKVTIATSEFNFQEILETINKRIEKLIGRDHKIGHSYFIQKNGWTWENYLHAFSNKIVPLMQEYFFGDYGKMLLILGQGFVNKKEGNSSDSKNFFAKGDHENIDEFNDKQIWELKQIKTEEEFKNALNILLNK